MALRRFNIPDELWARLAALDARCDMQLTRTDSARYSHNSKPTRFATVNYARQWRLRMWDRKAGIGSRFQIFAPTLEKAIRWGVETAEGWGWHRPVE